MNTGCLFNTSDMLFCIILNDLNAGTMGNIQAVYLCIAGDVIHSSGPSNSNRIEDNRKCSLGKDEWDCATGERGENQQSCKYAGHGLFLFG